MAQLRAAKVALASLFAVGAVTSITVTESPSAIAAPAVSATVNTSTCPGSPPTLVNGSFEMWTAHSSSYASPDLYGGYVYGLWHGYDAGPDQILYLKRDGGDSLPGWRTTAGSNMIELQRQVGLYTMSHTQSGSDANLSSNTVPAPRTGVATALTAAAYPQRYYNYFSPQAADGQYWAEINALDNAALYQDVTLPANAQVFWSLKNRGRTVNGSLAGGFSSDEQMIVKIGPVAGTLTQQTGFLKYLPTNTDVFSGTPTYSTTPSGTISNGVIHSDLQAGWVRYDGTYPADTAAAAGATRTLRFQFESVQGGNGWQSFGNLLDDLSFTPFYACPVERTLYIGQTSAVDVTGSDGSGNGTSISYGSGQALDAIGNATGNGVTLAQFSSTGNTVSFTPTNTGTFTVDYQVAMPFAGQNYFAASRITYNVLASPIVTFDPTGGSVSTPTATVTRGSPLSSISFPEPARDGYRFVGWYTQLTGGVPADQPYASSTIPQNDLTLYARWELVPQTPETPLKTSTLARTGVDFVDVFYALVALLAGAATSGIFVLRRRNRLRAMLNTPAEFRGSAGGRA